MSTNTELIARLRCLNPLGDSFKYVAQVTNEAADAIEALEAQAETLRYEFDAVAAIKAERDALQAQLAAAQETETKYDEALCTVAAQRDAYKDQLAAAQRQEPTGYLLPTTGKFVHVGTVMAGHAGANWVKLYAAPIPEPAEPAQPVFPFVPWSKEKEMVESWIAKQVQPEPNLFEFWWAEYMPDATQEQAFKAWSAAPSSKGVGVTQPAQQVNAMLVEALGQAEKLEHEALVALSEATYELKVGNPYTTATDTYKANNDLIHRLDKILNLQYRDRKHAAITAAAQQAQGVSEGWKLVPIEPTTEMLDAPPNSWPADAKVTWKAMIAAARQAQPEPSQYGGSELQARILAKLKKSPGATAAKQAHGIKQGGQQC